MSTEPATKKGGILECWATKPTLSRSNSDTLHPKKLSPNFASNIKGIN